MRAALIVAILASGHAARADPEGHGAERLAELAAKWPKLAAALNGPKLHAALGESTPCAAFDPQNVAPAISDATPSSVSPEGRTLVVVTTLDETGAKALGVESGPVVVGFDGPAGAIWARPLTSFSSCNPNGHGFTWSADHHRVFVATDTGRGLRVALVAVDDRVVRFQGFTSPVVTPSPDLQHVAWTPWFSGYPATDGTDGDLLHVDDLDVWGSIKPGAAEVWDVAWTTDATLTFCGRTPKLPAARYAAFIRGKRGVRVERVRTDCPSK